jgi:hypothetical protein
MNSSMNKVYKSYSINRIDVRLERTILIKGGKELVGLQPFPPLRILNKIELYLQWLQPQYYQRFLFGQQDQTPFQKV